MGFVKEEKLFHLNWPEGHEYHPKGEEGLRVSATSCPLGDFLKIANMAKFVKEEQASTEQISELFQTFAYSLREWNLEKNQRDPETGKGRVVPVPATIEGLYSQDLDFAMSIIMAWVGAISNVQEEEGKESASGDPSLEASIPMEVK